MMTGIESQGWPYYSCNYEHNLPRSAAGLISPEDLKKLPPDMQLEEIAKARDKANNCIEALIYCADIDYTVLPSMKYLLGVRAGGGCGFHFEEDGLFHKGDLNCCSGVGSVGAMYQCIYEFLKHETSSMSGVLRYLDKAKEKFKAALADSLGVGKGGLVYEVSGTSLTLTVLGTEYYYTVPKKGTDYVLCLHAYADCVDALASHPYGGSWGSFLGKALMEKHEGPVITDVFLTACKEFMAGVKA